MPARIDHEMTYQRRPSQHFPSSTCKRGRPVLAASFGHTTLTRSTVALPLLTHATHNARPTTGWRSVRLYTVPKNRQSRRDFIGFDAPRQQQQQQQQQRADTCSTPRLPAGLDSSFRHFCAVYENKVIKEDMPASNHQFILSEIQHCRVRCRCSPSYKPSMIIQTHRAIRTSLGAVAAVSTGEKCPKIEWMAFGHHHRSEVRQTRPKSGWMMALPRRADRQGPTTTLRLVWKNGPAPPKVRNHKDHHARLLGG
jgi:hypothetical protein